MLIRYLESQTLLIQDATCKLDLVQLIFLVEKTKVDVEVDVRKVVLVAELESRDLHGCLQKMSR